MLYVTSPSTPLRHASGRTREKKREKAKEREREREWREGESCVLCLYPRREQLPLPAHSLDDSMHNVSRPQTVLGIQAEEQSTAIVRQAGGRRRRHGASLASAWGSVPKLYPRVSLNRSKQISKRATTSSYKLKMIANTSLYMPIYSNRLSEPKFQVTARLNNLFSATHH